MSRIRSGLIVTVAAVAAVLGATLVPSSTAWPDLFTPCLLLCGQEGLADFLVNIVLYAPVGVGLALLRVRVRTALLLAFLLSAAVESVQAILPGRDSSAGDVIANTLGAGVGMLLVRTAPYWLRPSRVAAGRFSLGWAAAVIAIIAGTGWLTRPSFPAGTWYGRWTPGDDRSERYGGEVRQVTVGDLSVPLGLHPRSDSLRALLTAGARVAVSGVAGPPPQRLAPIFAIADRRQRELMTLGALRTDLYFFHRMRTHDLRLDAPDIRVRGRLAGIAAGDSFALAMWRQDNGFCLAVNGEATCELGFQPGRGWALFYWLSGAPPWVITGLDVFWMALLFFPPGLWASGHRSWALAVGAALAGLVFLPGLVGLQGSGFVEFIGVAVGLEAGLLVRRTARRL